MRNTSSRDFSRFLADLALAVAGLPIEVVGAYIVLTARIATRGSVPNDARWLAVVCGGTPRRWAAILDRLIAEGLVFEADGRIVQPVSVVGADDAIRRSRSPRKPRARLLRRRWSPTAEDRGYADALGLDAAVIEQRFRAYWLAGKGRNVRKYDWSLAWREWCDRNAAWRAETAVSLDQSNARCSAVLH